jgi:hypothetical protein
MTMFEDVDAEELARIFYHYQDALAVTPEPPANKDSCNHDSPDHNPRNHDSSWEHAPQPTRRLMIDAARLTLKESSRPAAQPNTARKFYAKPGEAEWGC